MGTNFYLKRKLKQYQKEEIKEAIDSDNYDKAEEMLQKTKEIHIGKRSGGWKFLWDAHEFKYFEPNKDSLNEFLKSGQIVDEYNKEFTFDQFWNEELKGWLDKGYDLESFYKSNPKEYKHYVDLKSLKPFEKYNLNINQYGEFDVEGLRFTIYEDFA